MKTLYDLAALPSLKPSPRMPLVFVGHGSPMNAIEDNRWRRSWQALGQRFGEGAAASYPTPQLILCVSAHWLTKGWQLTGMAWPSTIHDFGGFPQALFDVQYPAPGWPEAAIELASALQQHHTHQWGLDHGAWGVLQPMFPAATIPVIQLSMDYNRPPNEHLALGLQLRALRDQGVLIVGSGNAVHNLRAMTPDTADPQAHLRAHSWALEFDTLTARHMQSGDTAALAAMIDGGPLAKMAHPSHEHFLPLLYAAGAADAGEVPVFFNEGFQMSAISMRSAIWE